jgi:hypothetical protein
MVRNFLDGERMASKSRKQRVELFGANDEEALRSTTLLALAYSLDGRWNDAEQLRVQVMKTCKTNLGDDYPEMLGSMVNLASIYRKQGWLEEAEQLHVQVIEMSKTKLGDDNPETLGSMVSLVNLLSPGLVG